jgi:hypothetical protein
METIFFNEIRNICKNAVDFPFENYKVKDLINNNIKILFILESPHNSEVKNKYPLAGAAGISVSKALALNNEIPIGKLISDKTKNLDEIIGIMNICSIPMQYSPYRHDKRIECLINSFKTIRTTNKTVKSRDKSETNLIETAIVQNFKSRWVKCGFDKRKDLIIVLCGKMVNYFFDRYCNNIKIDYYKIPHPSFSNWDKIKYKHEVKEMCEKLKIILRNHGKDNQI